MHYVYLIQSIPFPKRKYIGRTDDLKTRFKNHNYGSSKHADKYKPWKLVMYLGFENKEKSIEFEKYLKSGSGRSFAKKRFWQKTTIAKIRGHHGTSPRHSPTSSPI